MLLKVIAGVTATTTVVGAVILRKRLLNGDDACYRSLVMPLLQRLDAETAHRLAIQCASLGFVPRYLGNDPKEMATTVFGRKFSNPVGLAAGFDKHAEAINGLLSIGFGFVEVGSVTPLPQTGNPRPRVFRLVEDQAIINRYGFNSDGHNVVAKRLNKWYQTRDKESYGIVGVNLGKNKDSDNPVEDYLKGIQNLGKYADYIVINVSSPNTPGLRTLQKKEQLENLILQASVERNKLENKPALLIKIAPDLTVKDKQDIANVILTNKDRVDGLIVANTTVDRPDCLKSSNKQEQGGLSGLPLRAMSTGIIYDMYKLTNGSVPIIGVGGIQSGKDAYEKIRAGASLVQVYTVLAYSGPLIVQKIKNDLAAHLRHDGFTSIEEVIGIDHSQSG